MSELTAGTRFLVHVSYLQEVYAGLKIYEVNPHYIKYLVGFQDHLFLRRGTKQEENTSVLFWK